MDVLVIFFVVSIVLNIVLAAYNWYLDREIEKTQNRIAYLEQRFERSPSMIQVHDR